MKAPETEEAFIQWYEACWSQRDDVEYPRLFGPMAEGVFTLEQTDALQVWLESDLAQVEELDPNWAPLGVRVAPPGEGKPYWTYVTSGLSNPFLVAPGEEWEDGAPSGLGYEMVLHTPEEEQWPVLRLLDMMAYSLVCARPFGHGHRYPVEGALDGGDSKLGGFVFVHEPNRPHSLELPSGKVELLTLVGVTRNEMAFSRSNGVERLMAKLVAAGTGYVTHPGREQVTL